MLLAPLLAPAANAHVPHDIVVSVAPAPDMDPSRPWWLAAGHDDVTDLYRSDDGGTTWHGVAGACQVDKLGAAAVVSDGTVAFLAQGRYWWGGAAGWRSTDLTIAPTAMAGADQLYFGTAAGIWAATPGDAPIQVWSGAPIGYIYANEYGVVGITNRGTLVWNRGGGWAETAPPAHSPLIRAATLDAGHLYLGADDGSAWRWDEAGGDASGWTPCGPDPLLDENPLHPEVVQLATDGVTVALAHADIGPLVSTDQCTTWSGDPAPLGIEWPEEETPSWTTTDQAFVVLGVRGDARLVAGYDGVAVERGGLWSHAALKLSDYPRGVGFSRDYLHDGLALLPLYGCGIGRSFAGGAGWDCPGQGLTEPGAQDVDIPPDAIGLIPAYALSDRIPFRSDDNGATWTTLIGPWRKVWSMELGLGGRVWAIGTDDQTGKWFGDVAFSADGGSTWAPVPDFAQTEGVDIRGVLDRGDAVLAWTDAEVYTSNDEGATFTRVWSSPDTIRDAVLWPDWAHERLIVADHAGIHVESGGVWTTATTPEGVPRVLAVTDDGTLFATTRTLRIWRSVDGGYTWTDIGASLDTQIEALTPHPDYAAFPELVASGPSGSWKVTADGTVTRWMGWMRTDDVTEWFTCAGSCEEVPWAGASLGVARRVEPGGSVSVWLRGDHVQVVGEATGTTDGTLLVDGRTVSAWHTEAAPLGSILAQAGGLSDSFHLVELTVVGGAAVLVDAAEASGAGSLLSMPTPQDTGDTADTADSSETGDTGDTADTGDTGDMGDTSGSADTATPDATRSGCCGGKGSAAAMVAPVGLVLIRRRRRRLPGHER